MAGNQGFASMSEEEAKAIQSKGGKASHGGGNKTAGTSARGTGTSARGAAGKTEAAKRGGQNSHRNQ